MTMAPGPKLRRLPRRGECHRRGAAAKGIVLGIGNHPDNLVVGRRVSGLLAGAQDATDGIRSGERTHERVIHDRHAL